MKSIYRVFTAGCAAWCGGVVLRAILRYGVEVPFWDQWDLVRMVREGSWARALLSGAGEHRVGLEWLLSAAWWQITGMNLRAEMVLNWCMAALFCVLAWAVTRRALPPGGSVAWTVLGAAGLLIFNPAAYQVWLWGLPLVHLLVPLLFICGVLLVQSRIPEGAMLAGMALCAMLASFTLASGLLLWILFVPVLACHTGLEIFRRRRAAAAMALVLLLFTMAVYGFSRGTSAAGPAGLATMFAFLLVYTGDVASFAADGLPLRWGLVAGSLLILFFSGAVWLAWRNLRGRPQWNAAVIWMCLGCYSLVSGMMVAAGRAGFGVAYAMESTRYVLASCFLPLACVALGALLSAGLAGIRPVRCVYALVLCATVALALAVCGLRVKQTNRAMAAATNYFYWQTRGKIATAAVNVVRMPEYRNVYPADDHADFKSLSNYLNARGWMRPPLWDWKYLRSLSDSSRVPDPRAGGVEQLALSGNTLRVAGWGCLPETIQSPHGVIVLAVPPADDPRVLGVVFPGGPRPGGAAGWVWSAGLSLERTLQPGTRIRCFAYDAGRGKAYLMAGERQLDVRGSGLE